MKRSKHCHVLFMGSDAGVWEQKSLWSDWSAGLSSYPITASAEASNVAHQGVYSCWTVQRKIRKVNF